MRIADATRQNRESASHLRLRRISLSPYLLPKLHVITPYLGRTCVRPNPTSRARSPSGAGPSARTQNKIPLRGGGKRPAGNMPTLQANDVVRRTTPKVVAPSGSTTSTGAPYQGTPQGEHHTRQVPRRTAAPRDQVPVHGGHEQEGKVGQRPSLTGHQVDPNETWMPRDASIIHEYDDDAPRPYMRFVSHYGTMYIHPRKADFSAFWKQHLNMIMERRDAAYGHMFRGPLHRKAQDEPDVPDQHHHQQGGLHERRDEGGRRAAAPAVDSNATISYDPVQHRDSDSVGPRATATTEAQPAPAIHIGHLRSAIPNSTSANASFAPAPGPPQEGGSNITVLINEAHERRQDISERTKGAIAAPPLQPRSINLTPVLEQAMRAPAAVSREHRPKTHNKPDQNAGRQTNTRHGTPSLELPH